MTEPRTEFDHMGTLNDDERCHRCGGENVRWSAPSPLWNRVMRGNDIGGEPRYGDLVCIRCFIVLAFEEGIDGTWRVTVDPEPEGLVYETPSGRVWDRERGLWVDPPPRCESHTRKGTRCTNRGYYRLPDGRRACGHHAQGLFIEGPPSDYPSSPGPGATS